MQESHDTAQSYRAPTSTKRSRFSVQGSRFIATLAPAADEDAARKVIEKVSSEYPDATHHAYAYRIGSGSTTIERASDSREPAGTAGPPMLQVLKGGNISDAVIIGTRYYGGTKLGIGGLTRAYRDCARKALENASLKTKEPLVTFKLELSYEDLGVVSRLVDSLEGNVLTINFSDNVAIQVTIPRREEEAFKSGFESACRGHGKLTRL